MSADRPTPAAIGGYAPGHYHCWCVGCGIEFVGDKRATQCFRCASDKSKPEPAAIETTLRDWQPIETAPKSTVDGSKRIVGEYLLGFCPDEDAVSPKGCICVVWWEPLTNGGVWFGEGGFEVRPTHWMPLPEPPHA